MTKENTRSWKWTKPPEHNSIKCFKSLRYLKIQSSIHQQQAPNQRVIANNAICINSPSTATH